jgi:hypothetical protein
LKFLHSHSMHEAFDNCPARFRLLETGAPRANEAMNFAFGRTFHAFADRYKSHCIETHRWSDIEIIGELVDQAIRETGLSTRYYEEMHLLCEQFARNEPIDIERSLMREGGIALDENFRPIEWRPEFDYDDPDFKAAGSKAAVRMRMDEILIDAPLRLLIVDDYKTDMHVPSPSDIADPASRWWKQANLYAWGALTNLYPDALTVEVRFKFVRWNIVRKLTIPREEVEAFGSMFIRRVQFIEAATEFPAIPSEQCVTCPFLGGACPIPNETAEYQTDEQTFAAQFVYSEATREAHRELLKAMVEENGGPITIGGLPVGVFEKNERRILDVEKTIEALRAEGIEGAEYLLDVSPSKLKDKLDADQFERVMKAASEEGETGVKFNVHQTKPELVALAERLGISVDKKMKVSALAQAIAKATAQRAA